MNRCVGKAITLQRVDHSRVIAGNGGEWLIQLVRQSRGDFTEHRQTCVVCKGIGLLSLALLHSLTLGNIQYRAHPANLRATRIDQCGLEHHHIQMMAIAMPPSRFIAFRRSVTGHIAAMALHGLLNGIGLPVRHGRHQSDQLITRPSNHFGKGAIHINKAAVKIAGTQANHHRIFHGTSPCGFGSPRRFCPRHAVHLSAQHPGRDENQQQEKRHQYEREGAIPRGKR